MVGKKLLVILVFAVIIASSAAVIVTTVNNKEVKISYEVDGDNTAGVDNVTGNPVRLTIPSEIVSDGKTYPVTHIKYGALDKCNRLEYLDLPSTMEYIEDGVLDSRFSLKEINVAEGNEFYKSVDGVLFDANGSLLVKYPASKNVESYTVPEKAWNIMDMAFYGASGLKEINLHDGIYSFGNYTFKDCKNLRSVTIPESLSTIGMGSFNGCSSLESIEVADANKNYESDNGVLYQIGGYKLLQYPVGSSAASFELPDIVIGIAEGAFAGCTSLKEITLNKNLIDIGARAFEGCTSLTTVHNDSCLQVMAGSDMYGSVAKYASDVDGSVGTYVGEDGFAYSYNMDSRIAQITGYHGAETALFVDPTVNIMDVDYEINSVGMMAFLGSDVERVYLPTTVMSVSATAFYGCSSMTEFCAQNLLYIGVSAFTGCDSLADVDLEMGISFIDEYAFDGVSTIELIVFNAGLIFIGDNAFNGMVFYDGDTEVVPTADRMSGTLWKGDGDGKLHSA